MEERNKGSLQFLVGALMFRFGERLLEGGPADASLLDDTVNGLGAYARPLKDKDTKAATAFRKAWAAIPPPVEEGAEDADVLHQQRRYEQLAVLLQLFHDSGVLARSELETFEAD